MTFSVAAISFLILSLTLGSKAESSSASSGAHSSRGPYHPAECCFSYVTHKVPRQRVSSYYETSSQCSKPGIVFISRKGYPICANPSDDWVQDYIKDLKEDRVAQKGKATAQSLKEKRPRAPSSPNSQLQPPPGSFPALN